VAYLIRKNPLFAKVGYAPNRAQRAVHDCPERFIVAAMGRRTGKSTAGGNDLLPEAYRAYLRRRQLEDAGQRMEFWIVGPEYSDSEKEFRTFYNQAKKLRMPFDKPGTYYNPHAGDLQASLWDGRFLLIGHSAKYPQNLVGEGLHGVIMAEAAKMKERVWTQQIMPTLADFRGWARFNSTPEGRNWFHGLYMKGVAKEKGWASFRFPSWTNTQVFPLGAEDPEILQLKQDLPEELFEQEIEAKFGQYVGRVFKDWDEDWHVRRMAYRPELPVYVASDYGWTNPTVLLFLQVDPFDRVHVVSEYYATHRTGEDVVQDILNGVQDSRHPALARAARWLYPDPEDPKMSHELSGKLQWEVMGDTGGPLAIRLNLIRRWLKDENPHLPATHPDRAPQLTVDPQCLNLQREMDAYRYPATRAEAGTNPRENPLDKDNHAPEALGRFFGGYYGDTVLLGAPREHRVRHTRGRKRRAATAR